MNFRWKPLLSRNHTKPQDREQASGPVQVQATFHSTLDKNLFLLKSQLTYPFTLLFVHQPMIFLKNSDNNNSGEGQYASSYGQGGGMGRRDENEYRVELTPGWRYRETFLLNQSSSNTLINILLNLTIQPNRILLSLMPGA